MLSEFIKETILMDQKRVAVEEKKDVNLKKVNPPCTAVNIFKVMFKIAKVLSFIYANKYDKYLKLMCIRIKQKLISPFDSSLLNLSAHNVIKHQANINVPFCLFFNFTICLCL